MCDYQGYEFGGGYLDSVCIDGKLWDADSCDEPGGPLYSGGDMACPQCNHEEWLEEKRELIEDEGYGACSDGYPESSCRFDHMKLAYEQDRETLKAWWRHGYARCKELKENS